MAALTNGDALTAFSFEFTIDGTVIPNVVEVNNIETKTSMMETKSMTPDGKYVQAQMLGPNQTGTLSLTILNTGDPTVYSWLMTGINGDFKTARKTGVLTYKDTTGSTVLTINFSDVMLTGVTFGDLKAGGAEAINMKIDMTFTELSAS